MGDEPDFAGDRDDLIEAARRGRLTPDQAEEIAASPDPAGFDPMAETWWSPSMTVAWIAYRSPDRVRLWWDEYRSRCRIEEAGTDGKLRLVPPLPARLSLLRHAARDEATEQQKRYDPTPVDEAQTSLSRALGANLLQANGRSLKTGERGPIPPLAWGDLEWSDEAGRDALRRLGSNDGYDEVLLLSKAVTSLWPGAGDRSELPETIPPIGAGYMPLYCAAQWIATRGGTIEVPAAHSEIWERAYEQLLARIGSGEVKVNGKGRADREKVDGGRFIGIAVDYPHASENNHLLSEDLYLRSLPYIDDRHWRDGFDDSLRNRSGVAWCRLMVAKPDVLRWWPFDLEREHEPDLGPRRTGAPGRPSSMDLVFAEFEARWQRGEAAERITAEAEALLAWLKATHPTAPSLTTKTVMNKLGPDHRRRQSARK